jgi:hypothetical protein
MGAVMGAAALPPPTGVGVAPVTCLGAGGALA